MESEWELLEEVFGMPQAELLRSYLEAQGIPVLLSQEGAGHAMGLTVGTLGLVEVLVPVEKLEAARTAAALMLSGEAPDADSEEMGDDMDEAPPTEEAGPV